MNDVRGGGGEVVWRHANNVAKTKRETNLRKNANSDF